MPDNRIYVKLGEMPKAPMSLRIQKGTTLKKLLEDNRLQYGAGIRVNNTTQPPTYVLKATDIVVAVKNVRGGR